MKIPYLSPDLGTLPMLNPRYCFHSYLNDETAVYFLLNKGEIVYIGATDKLATRLIQHRCLNKIAFDEVRYLVAHCCRELEKVYIRQFRPRHNFMHNPDWLAHGYPPRKARESNWLKRIGLDKLEAKP